MLSRAANDRLTRVGPGTPMGALLRRYWHPIAAVAELDDNPIRPVRLMGEDLVLFKDGGGRYGLVDRHCPHRSADLSYGFTEACGLRCNYHGWLFGADGRTLEQPYEDVAAPEACFKDKVGIKAYKVEAKAGMLWAYLGPDPAPLVPIWEPFTWEDGFRQVVMCDIPCNWLQCQENSIDPVHFEWMHDNWSVRLRDQGEAYSPRHLKIAFEEFDYGFVYRRVRENQAPDSNYWHVGRVCLWPNGFFLSNHIEYRVPVDDENTLSINWFFDRLPPERGNWRQESIPYWYSWCIDPATGRWITSHIINQDIVAWIGQGRITDRTREHLGQSDKGVQMLRHRLVQQLDALEAGETELKGIVRGGDPDAVIDIPIDRRQIQPSLRHKNDFAFFIGQPKEVREAYLEAMGAASREGLFA